MGANRPRPTVQEYQARAWSRVQPGPPWACWDWLGGTNADGYSQMDVNGRTQGAHRLIYQWTYGEVPSDLHIDHRCRNRRCVNPAHLEPVTNRENELRGMAARGVLDACPHGHPYDAQNTYRHPRTGKRQCRRCAVAAQQRYRQRKQAREAAA